MNQPNIQTDTDQDRVLIKDCLVYVQGEATIAHDIRPAENKHWQQGAQLIYTITPDEKSIKVSELADLFSKLKTSQGKTSFLVYKNQKYTTIKTEDIAYFYIRNESASAVCFDRQEYTLNYSLDQISKAVSSAQFFRINRKYLVSFKAIKEVEHYFQRKLFVRLLTETPDKLLINKEKSNSFLNWMEER